jgi:hypothetical protein
MMANHHSVVFEKNNILLLRFDKFDSLPNIIFLQIDL